MDTTEQARGSDTVTSQRVHAFQRMRCLPRRFGARCIIVEHRIFGMLTLLCPEYGGGYWDFFELSNGGFYMAPRSGASLLLRVDTNGYEGRMSPDAAGIVACAMVYSHMSFDEDGAPFVAAFHQLRDYVIGHPEQGEILRALD